MVLTADDKRPHMFGVNGTSGLEISYLTFLDSPQFHLYLTDVENVHVHHVNITVDIDAQQNITKNLQELKLSIFPLNTDGVDPSGRNILIENSFIQNFDDAVAVKPSNSRSKYSNCTEAVLIRNVTIRYSVGATIGSVSPSIHENCIRNVTFEEVSFHEALKAVYIKSNPGDVGTGLIENIMYSNINVVSSVWYPIWIGPQQQKQPGSAGKGCSFTFPLKGSKCQPHPLVTIRNITLRDCNFSGGTTLPGVILGNATNPISVSFENVVNKPLSTWGIQPNYYCSGANIQVSGFTQPTPTCV